MICRLCFGLGWRWFGGVYIACERCLPWGERYPGQFQRACLGQRVGRDQPDEQDEVWSLWRDTGGEGGG